MSATNLHPSHAGRLGRTEAIEALNDTSAWVGSKLHEWRRRIRERQQLAKLDERMLADIGLSNSERAFLANKPFWRE
jgi:uncharacterized protein YjiS (DUF1127 family)